jgi:TetR/AcrR family transcriptional regulator, cholesterol catabolism regulator
MSNSNVVRERGRKTTTRAPRKTTALAADRSRTNIVHTCRKVLEGLGLTSRHLDQAQANGTQGRALHAAISLFAERGFEACGMRDIAQAVGVKAPALYNYYASKEDILAEAMEYALAEFFVTVLEPIEPLPPSEQLEASVRGHVLFQLTHHELARANDTLLNVETIRRLLPADRHERLVTAQRAWYEMIRDLIATEPGRPASVDPRVAAFSVISMCDSVIGWVKPDGKLTPTAVADGIWTLVARIIGRGAD